MSCWLTLAISSASMSWLPLNSQKGRMESEIAHGQLRSSVAEHNNCKDGTTFHDGITITAV